MLLMSKRIFFISLGMGLAVVLLNESVLGSVADYNSFVQSYSDTIVCYDFEGTSDADRQLNKANTANASNNDLTIVDLREGGGVDSISYAAGFDETSTAYVPYIPYPDVVSFGKVFSTTNPLPLSTTVSYEVICCPKDTNFGHVVASYAPGPYRSYFTLIFQDSSFSTVFGEGSYDASSIESFGVGNATVDNWYYLALSLSYDENTDETTMNLYGANLTAGDTTLASSTKTVTGTFLTDTPYGIGAMGVNKAQWSTPDTVFFQASSAHVDQVVFYEGVKDESFFQANLDTILPGDPTPDIPGDANRDNKVDGSDVTILAGNWQVGVDPSDTTEVTWEMGDFNGDGQVDGSDVTILAGNWQAGVEVAAASVPEPSMVMLLLGGFVTLFGRSRRR